MSPAQEAHLQHVKDYVRERMDIKYRKGQEEHGSDGSNLWDVTDIELLDEAINEAIDQCVYLVTLRQKLCKRAVDN